MMNGGTKVYVHVSEWTGERERERGATVQYSKKTMNKYAEGFIPQGDKAMGELMVKAL